MPSRLVILLSVSVLTTTLLPLQLALLPPYIQALPLFFCNRRTHAHRQTYRQWVGAAQMGWSRFWAPCRVSSSISRWEEIRAAEPQSRTETQHAKQQLPEHSAQLQHHLSGLLQPSHTLCSLSEISRIFNHKCAKSNG